MEIFNADFFQKTILLLITAVISGFLIPYVLKMVDFRKQKSQKETEVFLARQQKIIDAQSQLLNDLTQYLWEWRYLCIRLTYYGGKGLNDQFKQAEQQYNDKFWDTLHRIRNEISKSRRLVSESIYKRLLEFYQQIVQFDLLLTKDPFKGSAENVLLMRDFNIKIFKEVTLEIDEILKVIAEEVQLNQTSAIKTIFK